jgi:hypothetical protein
MNIAKRFNLKHVKGSFLVPFCVFGSSGNQLLKIVYSENHGYSIIFTLKPNVWKSINNEIVDLFKKSFKKPARILIEEDQLVVTNIKAYFNSNKSIENIIECISWWDKQLLQFQKFTEDVENVVLCNGLPGIPDKSYIELLEENIKKNTRQSPVANFAGLKASILPIFLLAIGCGILNGVIEYKMHSIFPFLSAVLILSVQLKFYNKSSNGFNKNSWKFLIPEFLIIFLVERYVHIVSILWLAKGHKICFTISRDVLLYPDKSHFITLIVLIFSMWVVTSVEKRPEIVKVVQGSYFDEMDEEYITLTQSASLFLIKLIFIGFVLFFSSIILSNLYVLHEVYYEKIYFLYLIILVHAGVTLILEALYKRNIGFSPYAKHIKQNWISFVMGHIAAHLIFLMYTCAVTCFLFSINVKLDVFSKSEVRSVLLSNYKTGVTDCQKLQFDIGYKKVIELDYCEPINLDIKKGNTIFLYKGKGLFGIPYIGKIK